MFLTVLHLFFVAVVVLIKHIISRWHPYLYFQRTTNWQPQSIDLRGIYERIFIPIMKFYVGLSKLSCCKKNFLELVDLLTVIIYDHVPNAFLMFFFSSFFQQL